MRRWWLAPVLTAVVLGLILGGVLYVVHPLRLTASGAPATPSSSPSTPTSPRASASPEPRPTASPRVPNGPAFTELALLQSAEFEKYHWGKADELSLTVGISDEPILRCLRPKRVTTKSVAAFAATHHGLTTLGGEQVIRYYSVTEAKDAFDQLAGQVSECGDLDPTRRATVGQRHDPDLEGISKTRWWNIRGATKDDPMRGVLVIMRVQDRLMALCLTSDKSDPEITTDIIPLMHQGGLRMI